MGGLGVRYIMYRKSDRFGFINPQGEVIECNLLTALKYAMWPTPAFLTQPGRPLEKLSGSMPLIVFAEDLPTNNQAVLPFESLHPSTYAAFPERVHLIATT